MVCNLKLLFCILQDHPPEGGTPMEAEGGAKSPAASKVLYYSAVQPHGFILSESYASQYSQWDKNKIIMVFSNMRFANKKTFQLGSSNHRDLYFYMLCTASPPPPKKP